MRVDKTAGGGKVSNDVLNRSSSVGEGRHSNVGWIVAVMQLIVVLIEEL